uniref:Uncharacterized protein n=1 Tax=Lactuca sativa TaxID=4236 RepID=A0A9R1VG76_LACSA|nr:hypothetical protein LSAT_V11C500258260 [Lactuca sativa]
MKNYKPNATHVNIASKLNIIDGTHYPLILITKIFKVSNKFRDQRILRYLKYTIYHSLHITPSQLTMLTVYSDADWGFPESHRSTSIYSYF